MFEYREPVAPEVVIKDPPSEMSSNEANELVKETFDKEAEYYNNLKEPNDGFAHMARSLMGVNVDPLLAKEMRELESRKRVLQKASENVEGEGSRKRVLQKASENDEDASRKAYLDKLHSQLNKRADDMAKIANEPVNTYVIKEAEMNEERRAKLLAKFTTLAPDLSEGYRRKKANFILRAYLQWNPSELLKEADDMHIDLLEECVSSLK